ncbi:MAG TPA: phosphoribosylformylglycinamidine synthase subunit PurQ [Candidatus Kapabacteria bacterium]|nr:phosphoribosylformylglycinamidine synthase subunit PurQ [Candidatus Kapabacteria bacterium]
MKFGVVVFPGSNCDHDAFNSIQQNAGYDVEYLWHKDSTISNDIDCIVLPGGFSYGDYLRCGAVARFSPIMREIVQFADKGKFIIGICNGFQILTEAGLLPGALIRNSNLHFICKDVNLKVLNRTTNFSNKINQDVIRIPIAHGEGNYVADNDTIKLLEDNNQIVFKYSDESGNITENSNPNGSINNIAGIINSKGNVMGMMPHPERYCDSLIGGDEGLFVFHSIANFNN